MPCLVMLLCIQYVEQATPFNRIGCNRATYGAVVEIMRELNDSLSMDDTIVEIKCERLMTVCQWRTQKSRNRDDWGYRSIESIMDQS